MNALATKPEIPSIPDPQKPPHPFRHLLLMGIVLTFTLAAALKVSDYLEWDEYGVPKLVEKRQQKLEKALRELDEAEQYALLVETPGYYPCFSCKDSTHIFLYTGNVWKYGSTVKKEQGRYRKTLRSTNMTYSTQFVGNILECKKQELLKIYSYPTLPENMSRKVPLIRPPGNKIDQ